MKTINMLSKDFDYHLPPELIAQDPLPERDQSRLLVLNRADGTIEHSRFGRLPDYLSPGDCLVLNDTRVVPAKFQARRATGGKVRGLFLTESDGIWQVMLRPSSRLNPGEALNLPGSRGKLTLLESLGKGLWSAKPEPSGQSLEILEKIGRPPLPPYIKRSAEADDRNDQQRYQTVFASQPGSVAAPTAGLHFAERTFAELKDKGIAQAFVTLHVGLGTFAPVTAEKIEEHQMHAEWFGISADTAEKVNRARSAGGRTIAVGSTSLRVLESASSQGLLTAHQGWTDIFIKPGYEFGITDAMLTNFHLPRSTLLVLVCALAGRDLIFEAYRQAIQKQYRFYSYGDAMLIL